MSTVLPGRYLILIIGLYEFFYKFIPEPEGNTLSIKYSNLLQAVPNDDDLEQLYARDRKVLVQAKNAKRTEILKRRKVSPLMNVYWAGKVKIKHAFGFNTKNTSSNGDINKWTESFLVIQGKRIVWWHREKDIDDYKSCQGQMLLYGHAGITPASPVEIKEVGKEYTSSLLSVFGHDELGSPSKCTILCTDPIDAKNFKDAVHKILSNE